MDFWASSALLCGLRAQLSYGSNQSHLQKWYFHQFDMKGHGFLKKLKRASQTAEEFRSQPVEKEKAICKQKEPHC